MPTAEQPPAYKAFFETFGYAVFPGLLREDVAWITQDYEEVWRSRPDIVHGADGKRLTSFPQLFVAMTPRLSTLIEDPHLVAIVETLLGDGYALNGGDGTVWDGDTGWHSDVIDEQWDNKTIVRNIKVAIYPDELTHETGALRVIPGSHLTGDRFTSLLRAQMGDPQRELGVAGCDVPAVTLASRPGDVIIFDHRLKHGAFGGGRRRRQMCMNLMAPLRTPQEREAMLAQFRWYRDVQGVDWKFPDGWVESAPPARLRRLATTLDLARQVRSERGWEAALAAHGA